MSAFHDFSGFVEPKDGKEIDVIDLFYWNDVVFGSGEKGQLESDKKGRFWSGRKGHCAVG